MVFKTTISIPTFVKRRRGKSRRVGMKPHPPTPLSTREGEKSRRDGILLTVGFNLRTRIALRSHTSPAGTTQWRDKVSSLRDFDSNLYCLIRRLNGEALNEVKSTVNKVLSLRDISLLTQHNIFFIPKNSCKFV